MFTLLPLLTNPEYEVNVHFEINMKMKKERRERDSILARMWRGKDALLTLLEGEPARGRQSMKNRNGHRHQSAEPHRSGQKKTNVAKRRRAKSVACRSPEKKDRMRHKRETRKTVGGRERQRVGKIR